MTERLPRLVARIRATVHAKLLAGFLAIAVLLIALGAVGLQVPGGVNRRAEELLALQHRITAFRALQREASLPSSWSWDERTLDAALDQLQRHLERLPPVAGEEAEALARLREVRDELTRVLGQVLDLARAGRAAEARELQLGRASPLADRLERLTTEFVSRAETDLAARVATSQDAYVTSRWVVMGFAAGSIALALLLGCAISWSIIGPVALMEARLRRIASGDFSQRLEVPNRDELGALAAQFNRMAVQLDEPTPRSRSGRRRSPSRCSRRPSARSCASSAARPPTSSPCSRPSWLTARACAAGSSASSSASMA